MKKLVNNFDYALIRLFSGKIRVELMQLKRDVTDYVLEISGFKQQMIKFIK